MSCRPLNTEKSKSSRELRQHILDLFSIGLVLLFFSSECKVFKITTTLKAALIVTGESRAEMVADNDDKTKDLIPLFIFHLTHSLQLSSVPKNICNI